jgi:hypothetical protein
MFSVWLDEGIEVTSQARLVVHARLCRDHMLIEALIQLVTVQ